MAGRKFALLILVGGWQVPNLLTGEYLRPNIIVPIASYEALKESTWDRIKPAIKTICPDGVQEPYLVDAFDLEGVRIACRTAYEQHADHQWVFNVTAATTVMSIGAYEIAKEKGVDAWYLDTKSRRVVVLNATDVQLYHLTIADYMKAYGRDITLKHPATPSKAYIAFAKRLAQEPKIAIEFRECLQNRDQSATLTASPTFEDFCRFAQAADMLDSWKREGDQLICT